MGSDWGFLGGKWHDQFSFLENCFGCNVDKQEEAANGRQEDQP